MLMPLLYKLIQNFLRTVADAVAIDTKLVTNNIKHFEHSPNLKTVNWF